MDSTATNEEYLSTLARELHESREGLPRLVRSDALDAGALLHARDMAERNYFAHESPEDSTPTDRVAIAAPRSIVMDVKENLFFLESNRPEGNEERARIAQEGLMESPGHRKNILNNRSTHFGLAVYRVIEDDVMREYTVQLFGRDIGTWTSGRPPREWDDDSGAKSFPVRFVSPDVELYVVDVEHPRRRYPYGRDGYMMGGFIPRLGPNDRTLQLPTLDAGSYFLAARFRGEDAYAPSTFSFVVTE